MNELAQLITECTGAAFVGHDSYYRGEYEVADTPTGRLEVQPNEIPGDDHGQDLYAPQHPDIRTLLLITTPAPTSTLTTQLDSIEGLHQLPEGAT